MAATKLVAKAVLKNKAGKILILRRSASDPIRPGGKDFPGGTVDEGENHHDAVIRELQEEIGVTLKHDDVELSYAATTFYEGHNSIRFLYVGKLESTTAIKLSWEHDEYYWLTPQETLSDFDHPVWSKGLSYLIEHDLL